MAKYQRVQIPSQSQAGLPEPPIFDISSSRQIPAPALAPAPTPTPTHSHSHSPVKIKYYSRVGEGAEPDQNNGSGSSQKGRLQGAPATLLTG